MFTKKTKMTYANRGLATIARNRLEKSNPGAVYELARVARGVAIVPSTQVQPAAIVPATRSGTRPKAGPAVVDKMVTFVVRMRSLSDKWITLHEPMPNGTIWVYRPYVTAIHRLPEGDGCELVVPLQVAKKKGWAA